MPEVLKLPKLSKDDGVAEVKVRTRWIDAEFDAERTTERELRAQFFLTDNLGRALLENGKSFVGLHEPRVSIVAESYLLLFNNSRTCSMVSGLFCV